MDKILISNYSNINRIRFVLSFLIGIFSSILFCVKTEFFLQDPDNFWHVKVGSDFLLNKIFPTTDTYSYTFSGSPWIAKEWLGQVFFAVAYKISGWNGVVSLVIITIGLTMFLLVRFLSYSFKPIVVVSLVFVIFILINPAFTARPLIFTLPIMVVWTYALFKAAYEERSPSFILLPLIWLWANVHGTFTFGFVIAALAGLDYLARIRVSAPEKFWHGMMRWLVFGVLTFLVSLLNPYGLKAVLATFTVAHGNEAVQFITEWEHFNPSIQSHLEIWLLILLSAALFFRPKIGGVKIMSVVFFLHLLLIHARFSILFVVLVPIILAPELSQQFSGLSVKNWAEASRDKLEQFLGKYCYSLSIVVGIVFITTSVVFNVLSSIEPSHKISAKAALAFVESHNIKGNVFNSYNFGGTLIFHGIKTYIDGRTDQLFLNGFMKRDMLTATSKGKPELEKILKQYDMTWALLTANDARIPFFKELPDWKLAYSDEDAVVFTRTN